MVAVLLQSGCTLVWSMLQVWARFACFLTTVASPATEAGIKLCSLLLARIVRTLMLERTLLPTV